MQAQSTKQQAQDDFDEVVLNVGGRVFRTARFTLRQHAPNYFTARLDSMWARPSGAETFVDRCPVVFEHVLNFQRGYALSFGQLDVEMLVQDARFYGIAPLITLCEQHLGLDEADDDRPTEQLHYDCREMVILIGREQEFAVIDRNDRPALLVLERKLRTELLLVDKIRELKRELVAGAAMLEMCSKHIGFAAQVAAFLDGTGAALLRELADEMIVAPPTSPRARMMFEMCSLYVELTMHQAARPNTVV